MLEGLMVDLVPYDAEFEKLRHAWENSEAGLFWHMSAQITTRARLERRAERSAERREHGDPRLTFGVRTKDATPIGIFMISRMFLHHRAAELSGIIGEPDFWGGGYGTDALLLMVDYVFNWLDLRRLWLGTMSVNPRVVRQMEKVGFLLEGQRREGVFVHGEWYDILTYGLLREEWPGREAMIEQLGLRAPGEG